ncbi:hypothetical protein DMK78_23565 [Salmonella enterica]|uniref:hypothetical protein n=1 Tax=Enterobacteriaceae TaxID=543 RepID=UPI000972FD3A|nr:MULTISPECIES: hypothetical protein [Enterobacteriaceae]EAB6670222.1 hypothetical protein [Salmonella enterica subsp. enterica serovar Enteritidis]EAP6665467.1 hypothetical protein [Salmonella enterica]EBX4171666.1 hypothetical protein [Salmonella enterica subsp. enterica serovar Stanley]ECH8003140.1 hypothetical protein [Salmonella enterica subsp. enterica serovar Bovismorbificans]EDB9860828.1 hypothetical protein [Salmonella enterica subsp. enterica serovar Newport]EDQ9490354.1 hypothetic
MVTIEFKSFADMVGLSEGELAYHINNKILFKGYELPQPVLVGWNKKRKFSYDEAINFMKKLEGR